MRLLRCLRSYGALQQVTVSVPGCNAGNDKNVCLISMGGACRVGGARLNGAAIESREGEPSLPAVREGSWTTAALMGGVLGLVAYATYDLTNLATLRQWSTAVSVVDIGRGPCLTAILAVAGYAALTRNP